MSPVEQDDAVTEILDARWSGVQPEQQTPKRWTAGRIAKWVGITLGALLVLGMIGAALDPEGARQAAAPAPTSVEPTSAPADVQAPALSPEPAAERSAPPAPPRATAQDVVDRLERAFPAPNARDNTGSCAPACAQLITTDAVSVYEWRQPADAARFGSGEDTDVVGRFVLSYAGSDQQATSNEARAEYLRIARTTFAGR